MATTTARPDGNAGKLFIAGLWAAQVATAAAFVLAGVTKLTTPIPELAAAMPWAGDWPEAFVRFIGFIDLAGGLGLLLPALTRIQPRLTVHAALGCAILQCCAAAFHLSRGEFAIVPINAVLLALSIFILWGRAKKAPIAARN